MVNINESINEARSPDEVITFITSNSPYVSNVTEDYETLVVEGACNGYGFRLKLDEGISAKVEDVMNAIATAVASFNESTDLNSILKKDKGEWTPAGDFGEKDHAEKITKKPVAKVWQSRDGKIAGELSNGELFIISVRDKATYYDDVKSLAKSKEFKEGLDEAAPPADLANIKKVAAKLKVGDMTTFGRVEEIKPNGIKFKAKDTPKVFIKFDQRSGRDKYTLKYLAVVESMDSTTLPAQDRPLGKKKFDESTGVSSLASNSTNSIGLDMIAAANAILTQ